MLNAEIRRILAQVVTSWQVIAVTIVLVIYVFLINYVSRIHQKRPRLPSLSRKKSKSSETPLPAAASPAAKTDSEELGLEEETVE